MKNWKATLWIAMALGVIASVIALDFFPEVSALSMFMMTLAMAFGAYTVWDMLLLKHVSTHEQIVEKGNIAYAIYMCIPALLILAASLVK
jgi:hypothetical protein